MRFLKTIEQYGVIFIHWIRKIFNMYDLTYYCTISVKIGMNKLLIPLFLKGANEDDVLDALGNITNSIRRENYKVYGMSLNEMVVNMFSMKENLRSHIGAEVLLGEKVKLLGTGLNVNFGKISFVEVKGENFVIDLPLIHTKNVSKRGESKIELTAIALNGTRLLKDLPPLNFV